MIKDAWIDALLATDPGLKYVLVLPDESLESHTIHDVAEELKACREALLAFGAGMWECREDGLGIFCKSCSADLDDGVVDGVCVEDDWLKTGHYGWCPYEKARAALSKENARVDEP